MARKPEPQAPTAWTCKIAAKQTRLGEVEAADEREAIEREAKEFIQHTNEADCNAAPIMGAAKD